MAANDSQVGGFHYKTRYEHWDLCAKYGLGYFDGQITKYVTRWRQKAGLQDIKKALHFAEKLKEIIDLPQSPGPFNLFPVRPWLYTPDVKNDLAEYAQENKLLYMETDICYRLIMGPAAGPLDEVINLINILIENADTILNKPIGVNQSDPPPRQAKYEPGNSMTGRITIGAGQKPNIEEVEKFKEPYPGWSDSNKHEKDQG
jgi:hypothetical protein